MTAAYASDLRGDLDPFNLWDIVIVRVHFPWRVGPHLSVSFDDIGRELCHSGKYQTSDPIPTLFPKPFIIILIRLNLASRIAVLGPSGWQACHD